jgi:integrase
MPKQQFIYNEEDLSKDRDGSLTIYNRPALDGGVSPVFQFKIKLPNNKDIRRSTKTKNRNEAVKVAMDAYQELHLKHLTGKPVRLVGFKKALNEFADWYMDTKEIRIKPDNRKSYLAVLKKYPYEYFVNEMKDISLDLIDDDLIQEYFNWRRDNHNISNNTLRREMTMMRTLYDFCKRKKKYIDEIPDWRLPPRDKKRRPAWTLSEYRKITRKMRIWVDADRNSRVRRQRFYFQQFFLISANCGARVGELRNLRWNEIRTEEYKTGDKRLVLSLEGKTGRRESVCNVDTHTYFNNLWDYRSSELAELESDTPLDEFVFCHFDGTSIGKMNKSFGSLMEYCDTERDVYGEKYTIYSLRHFYAQMRLNEEVSVYDLASQMGTSVEMISRFYDQPNNVVRGLNITKSSKQKKTKDFVKYPYE